MAQLEQGVPLEDLPTPVLYDVFQDAASVLTGCYLRRQREAAEVPAADAWWAKVMALREQLRAVDPDDRPALVAHIVRWRREASELGTS